jgi:phage FluMu gp28-like protein
MRNVPFHEQLFVWRYILNRLRRWRAKLDEQGLGAHLAERLVQLYGQSRVEGVRARADWWRDEGAPLKSRFEDGRILIPRDADVAADLRQVRVIDGAPAIPVQRNKAKGEDAAAAAGKVRRHADSAVALFHASAALRQGGVGEPDAYTDGRTGAPAGFYPMTAGEIFDGVDIAGY